MRFVKISNTELVKIRKLYEALMSYACYGLFFREGLAIGEEFVAAAKESGGEYFSAIKEILKYRGWVADVNFEGGRMIVKGSVEVSPGSDSETCHRLRGILQKVIESYYKRRARCTEIECESLGAEKCIFNYEFVDLI